MKKKTHSRWAAKREAKRNSIRLNSHSHPLRADEQMDSFKKLSIAQVNAKEDAAY